jgi:hypothetical protein
MDTSAAPKMNRSYLRSKSIGVRVTESDFARLQALADAERKSVGEWSRNVLLEKLQDASVAPSDVAVLSELLALRRIVINLFFAVAEERTLTTGEMNALIQNADTEKLLRARERLRAAMREEIGGSDNDN